MLPQTTEQDRTIRVATCNLRYGAADDGENSWSHRSTLLFDTLRRIDADIISTQEGLSFQLEELDEAMPSYGRCGRGRYHGVSVDRPHEALSGEHCAVYYRKPRLELRSARTVWLSETPNEPGSHGWGAELARVATVATLDDHVWNRSIVVINTHLHWGEEVTRGSAAVLASLLKEIRADSAVLVTGDFNLPPDSPEHVTLESVTLAGGLRLVDSFQGRTEPGGTFHGFSGAGRGRRIDWILASNDMRCIGAHVDRSSREGRYPSDHFPVVAEFVQKDR